ncbi:hypothetical protein [Streptomyces sp. NPDC005494]|uniref:hypothetical protein n=1 Tax=unclassified Streptomyces TaxID=2593676 RepID=UPI0036C6CD07
MTLAKNGSPSPGSPGTTRAAAVTGTLCVLAAAWLLLITTRAELAEGHDFRAAATCAPNDQGDDCLRTAPARIERTHVVSGRKTPMYWLYVTEADGSSTRTRIDGSPQEPPHARKGAHVEVTYWRGQIRFVDFGTTHRYTNADPRDDYRLASSSGLGLAFYGTLALWGAYWMSRRSWTSLRAYPWQAALPVGGGLALTLLGMAAPFVTDGIGPALRLVALGTIVVLLVSLALAPFLKRRQAGDDTVTLTPCPLLKEKVFPGRVMGGTPYADSGGGFLVAGPGCLASTPDPTGSAYRREVPHTLTPVRVRPPYRTDPADRPDHGGRALVLECEDNGEAVLVVTHRKHMPLVLGALRHSRPEAR